MACVDVARHVVGSPERAAAAAPRRARAVVARPRGLKPLAFRMKPTWAGRLFSKYSHFLLTDEQAEEWLPDPFVGRLVAAPARRLAALEAARVAPCTGERLPFLVRFAQQREN